MYRHTRLPLTDAGVPDERFKNSAMTTCRFCAKNGVHHSDDKKKQFDTHAFFITGSAPMLWLPMMTCHRRRARRTIPFSSTGWRATETVSAPLDFYQHGGRRPSGSSFAHLKREPIMITCIGAALRAERRQLAGNWDQRAT